MFSMNTVSMHAAFEDVGTGARSVGLGNAYTALADDLYAIHYNPSGLSLLPHPEFTSTYSKLHRGLTDDSEISNSFVAIAIPLNYFGSKAKLVYRNKLNLGGIGLAYQKTELNGLYRDTILYLSYGNQIMKRLHGGLTVKMLQHQFGQQDSMSNAFGPTGMTSGSPDPVFKNGKSKTAYALDAGFLYDIDAKGTFRTGIAGLNINRPNVALGSERDNVGSSYKWSLAYRRATANIAFELNRREAINSKKDTIFALAGEKYFRLFNMGTYGVRASLVEGSREYRAVNGGLSYLFGVGQIDYGFTFPLKGIEETAGTHRITFTLRNGRSVYEQALDTSEELSRSAFLFEEGKYKEARDAYGRLIDGRNKYQDEIALFRMGEADYNLGRYAKSYGVFEQINIQTDNPVIAIEAKIGMAESMYKLNNIKYTEQLIAELMVDDPAYADDVRIKVLKSRVHLARADYKEAHEVLAGENTEEAVWMRMIIYQQANQFAKALAEIRRHFERFPQSSRAQERQLVLAETLFALGEHNEAHKEFNTYITNYAGDDKISYCRYMMASSQLFLGGYPEAYQGFSYVSKHSNNTDFAEQALFLKAEAAWALGKKLEAGKIYNTVAKKSHNPELKIDAQYRICLIYLKNNNMKKLEKICRKFAAKDIHGRFNALLGYALYKRGNSEEAFTYFNRAFSDGQHISDIDKNLVLLSLVGSPVHVQNMINRHEASSSDERYTAEYFVAEGFFDANMFAEAEKLFNKIATHAVDPRLRVYAELRYADCLSQKGQFDDALKHIKRITDEPSYTYPPELTFALWMGLGHLYFKQTKYTRAVETYDRIIENFSSDERIADAYYYKGESLSRKGIYSQAIETWIALVHAQPTSENASKGMSNAINLAFGMGDYTRVQTLSELVAELYPETEVAFDSSLQSAKALYNMKEYAAAVALYQQLLRKTDDQARKDRIEKDLSRTYYQIGLRHEDGENILDSFAKKYPNRSKIGEVYWQIGVEFFDSQRYQDAEKRFYKVITEYPHAVSAKQALFYLAESIYWQGRYEDAIGYYERFRENYADEILAATARFRMANAYFKLGQIPLSIELYNEILASDPTDEVRKDVMLNIAMGYYRTNDIPNAVEAFKEFSASYPNSTEANTALYQVGRILQEEGQFADAVRMYRQVKPHGEITRMELVYRIGVSHVKNGDSGKAISTLRELVSLKPSDNTYRFRGLIELAGLLEKDEQYKQVIELYKQLKKSTDDAETKKLIDMKLKEITKKYKSQLTRR